jgi:hypothetical protein
MTKGAIRGEAHALLAALQMLGTPKIGLVNDQAGMRSGEYYG